MRYIAAEHNRLFVTDSYSQLSGAQVFAVVLRPGHGSTWDLSGSWDSPLDSITLQFFKSPLSGFETASEAYAA